MYPFCKNVEKPTMMVMQSDTLGMTVVEEFQTDDKAKEISAEEWVQIITSKGLEGYSYNRIYFTFLKGIPTFLDVIFRRMKIWLLLCTDKNAQDYKFVGRLSKRLSEEERQKQLEISGVKKFTTSLFSTLSSAKPPEEEKIQIEKDIHRSYSNKKNYRFTEPMLRKILYALSNSGVEYSQGMNYILLHVIIYCLESVSITQDSIESVPIEMERDIFIILREIVLRLEEVFSNNNIFKILKQLEQKISQTVPDVFYSIYQHGMDTYSCFSQNYYSLLTYSDPPEELCKQMMDLFFLVGEKAITSVIVRMLEIAQTEIMKIKDPETMQSFLKKEMFHFCYKTFCEEKAKAQTLSDFGISFYQNVANF